MNWNRFCHFGNIRKNAFNLINGNLTWRRCFGLRFFLFQNAVRAPFQNNGISIFFKLHPQRHFRTVKRPGLFLQPPVQPSSQLHCLCLHAAAIPAVDIAAAQDKFNQIPH